ncbi:MAG: hypothetical protein ACTS9Y_09330 [Methylophilus sp.]|uniref:hypothetical protein n=1 Tax=Methylophilus sp. TaxID=29541 RepID=UPI003F9FE9BB
MDSGLVSLAYLGELGVASNLAYITLNKSIYFEYIRKNIRLTLLKFQAFPRQDSKAMQQQVRILQHLIGMLSSHSAQRKNAWVRYKLVKNTTDSHATYFTFTAGKLYDFFETESDTLISQYMLITAGIFILLTLMMGFKLVPHGFDHYAAIWYWIFAVLLITNLYPLICILLWRWMRSSAKSCTDSFEVVLTVQFLHQIKALTMDIHQRMQNRNSPFRHLI